MEFDAIMQKAEGVNGAYVEMPFDLEEVFGVKRLKAKAMFDAVEYKGSVVRMDGKYLIGITKAIRDQIGKQPGDKLHVIIEKDEAERTIELPEDFKEALEKDKDALAFYESLSYTNKNKYFLWVTSAKKVETRAERILLSVEKLRNKEKLK
jgi:bifunctional DNA-binding transcriptional regulator/antitoxin component of YhaV-PrlF toxin-antitoxin module